MPQYNNTQLIGATGTVLNITAPTLIKAGKGAVFSVDVVVAGTTSGTLNDSATVAGVTAANQIANVGSILADVSIAAGGFPFSNGLVATPGTGQTLVVAFR